MGPDRRFAGGRGAANSGGSGLCRHFLEVGHLLTQLFVAELFRDSDAIARALGGDKKLVELGMNRLAIPVLGVLNEEHHKERHDGRGGVDHQLPGVGEMKDWAGDAPGRHDGDRGEEGRGRAGDIRNFACGTTKYFVHVPPVGTRMLGVQIQCMWMGLGGP